MDNGKIQPSKTGNDKTARKGRIKLGLQRTLSTEKYQSIVIHYELDEEIEWSSPSEREKKLMNWETILTREFKQIHDRVLDELKLSHKKAYFVDHVEEKDTRPEPGEGFDDLDSLDSIG